MALFIIYILVAFAKPTFQFNGKEDFFKNMIFECHLHINEILLSMNCNSLQDISNQGQFVVLKLQKQLVTNIQEFLESTKDSFLAGGPGIYICENIYRSFMASNASINENLCTKNDFFSDQVSSIQPSINVKSFDAINITKINPILVKMSEFTEIEKIVIQNTPIQNYSGMELKKLPLLVSLTLKSNDISDNFGSCIKSLPNLQVLDLSQNMITNITKQMFATQSSLWFLNLSSNWIHFISGDAFSGIKNLKEIYLMDNKLTMIDPRTFELNFNLKNINISKNCFKKLPKGIFYKSLEKITCSECNLTELNEDTFENGRNLWFIDLSRNEIPNIPPNTFRNTPLLYELLLNHNKLSEIPTLGSKERLRYLHVHHNEIRKINENLSVEAPYLYSFKINENNLGILKDSQVTNFFNLEFFDLSKNNITRVQLGLTDKMVYIRAIDFSDNSINSLKVRWRYLTFLEKFKLDNNKLTLLDIPPCLGSVKSTITFSFKNNTITRLNMTALIEDERRIQEDRALAASCFFNGMAKNFVDLTSNPLNCDCNLYPFYKYLNDKKPKQLTTFINTPNLTCSEPQFIQNASIISLEEDILSCQLNETCPSDCVCGIRGKDNAVFLNCTGTGVKYISSEFPIGTTVLYLESNNWSTIEPLNLLNLENITELYLGNNNLNSLEGWKIPLNLWYLSLRNNNLTSLPDFVLDFIEKKNEFQLSFGGNTDVCECDKVLLKRFLIKHKAFIRDLKNILCKIETNGTESLIPLHMVPDSALCLKTVLNPNSTTRLISIIIFFTLIILMLLFYYRQRQLILSFLYIHCDVIFQSCFEETEIYNDKSFDAFIAYNSKERHIVMEMLKELEEKEPYFQLCIHERNWLPGRFISDNILSSIASSKRTIMILSESFISSPWFGLELRAAIYKASGDKKSKIIVILADKSVSLDGIDTEIRHVISKRTYLVWGEHWFWEKLRYSMPRKSCLEEMEPSQSLIDMKSNEEVELL